MGASTTSDSTTQANQTTTAATASTSSNPRPINPTASSSSTNPSVSSSVRRSSSNIVLARPSWGGKVGSGVLPASSPPDQDTEEGGDGQSISASGSGRSMRPAPIQSRPTIRSAVEEASIQPTPRAPSSSRIATSSSGVKNVSSTSNSNNPLRSAMRGGRASHAAQEVNRNDSSSPSKNPVASKRQVAPSNHPSSDLKSNEPVRKKARISDVFQRKEISDYGSEEEDPDFEQEVDQGPGRIISSKDKGKGKAKAKEPPVVKSRSLKAGDEHGQRKSLIDQPSSSSPSSEVGQQPSRSKVSKKTNEASKENQKKKTKGSIQSKLPFAKQDSQIKTKTNAKISSTPSSRNASQSRVEDDDDEDYADDTIQSLSSSATSRSRNQSTSLAELQRGISDAQRRAMAKRLRRVISLGLEREQDDVVQQDEEEAEREIEREEKEERGSGNQWLSKEERKWKGKLNDADVLWNLVEKSLKEAG